MSELLIENYIGGYKHKAPVAHMERPLKDVPGFKGRYKYYLGKALLVYASPKIYPPFGRWIQFSETISHEKYHTLVGKDGEIHQKTYKWFYELEGKVYSEIPEPQVVYGIVPDHFRMAVKKMYAGRIPIERISELCRTTSQGILVYLFNSHVPLTPAHTKLFQKMNQDIIEQLKNGATYKSLGIPYSHKMILEKELKNG